MNQNREIGILGEKIASDYLKKIGYVIIQRNFMCRQGEIDIIAQDKDEKVFIEVKTRTNLKYGLPIEAVTPIKQKHIKEAVKYYLYKKSIRNEYIRIDVIEVYLNESKQRINHIKQIL